MGKIVVTEFVSLDGVMEAPGGEPDFAHPNWVFAYMSEAQEQYKLEEIRNTDAQLLGRRTYEAFAGAWPERQGEFADKMNTTPKFVASTTLEGQLDWNAEVLIGDLVEQVQDLTRRFDGDILVGGSAQLVHWLTDHDLVDEYRLMVFPVLLGTGKRLFPENAVKVDLALADTQPLETGVMILTYTAKRGRG